MGWRRRCSTRGHRAEARITEESAGAGRYRLAVGTAEFGNGTSTVHQQLAAEALGVEPGDIRLVQADTDAVRHDTGAFGSTGTAVAGAAVLQAAERLAALIRARAGEGQPHRRAPATAARKDALSATGHADGLTRTVSFNVQGFLVAVHTATGEVRILHSVHAADAGTVIHPRQCAGQIEGAVAQALSAALWEEVAVGAEGRVRTRDLRDYHVARCGELPQTEVCFADTADRRAGPFGAKPMSESPFNPVAPALANAIADATGVRVRRLPLRPDRLWQALTDAAGSGPDRPGRTRDAASASQSATMAARPDRGVPATDPPFVTKGVAVT